jgi:hypothetical protein
LAPSFDNAGEPNPDRRYEDGPGNGDPCAFGRI